MNINKTVMIHVAVEILAFSYLYSLVNKKTKSLEVEIEEMREDYEKKIDDLYEKVEILKNAIIQITKPRYDSPIHQQPQHHVQQPTSQSSKSIKKNVKTQENTPSSNTFVLPPMFMSNPFVFNNEQEIKSAEVVEDNEENNNEEKTEETEITDKELEEIEQLIESSVE
jgi:hypothetical protein